MIESRHEMASPARRNEEQTDAHEPTVAGDASQLLDALRGDDENAKRKAIEQLYARLTSHARKKLGSQQNRSDGMPESVVQSVIVREVAGGSLTQINDDQHLEARLRRAVNNKIIDRDRKRRPDGLPVVGAEGEVFDAASTEPGPATQVVSLEEITHAANQLMAFKEACMSAPISETRRRFLELAIFEDLSLDEIAQQCETTVSTVKVRLSEARRAVVRHLLQSLRAEVDGTKWAIIDMILIQRRSVERCCETLGINKTKIKHIIGCDVYPRLKDAYGVEGIALFERMLGNRKR